MNEYILWALGATALTWLVTALGAGSVLFIRRTEPRLLSSLLGFAAGVMIAASFWSLLQPAIERCSGKGPFPPWFVATAGFLAGALFLYITDRVVSLARRNRPGDPDPGRKRTILLVLAITMHNIPEGLAVGVAFGALQREFSPEGLMGAISIATGIGLQNFPEGAAVSLPLLRDGMGRGRSFLLGQASGMAEPVAGVLGALLVTQVEAVLPWALSFAAGAMILVAVHELIPEGSVDPQHPYTGTAGVILGFAAMMLLDVMLG